MSSVDHDKGLEQPWKSIPADTQSVQTHIQPQKHLLQQCTAELLQTEPQLSQSCQPSQEEEEEQREATKETSGTSGSLLTLMLVCCCSA